jgi:hypothetical protein
MRVGGLLPDVRSPAWRDAGAVLILLGTAVLAAANLWAVTKPLLPGSAFYVMILPSAGWRVVPSVPTTWSAAYIALAAGWAVAAVAAVRRWRRAAAVGASLAAAGETAHLAVRYAADPAYGAEVWWQVVLAVMTALAAITVLLGEKSQTRPLSWRAIAAVWIPVTLAGAGPLILWGFAEITGMVSLTHGLHLFYGVLLVLALILLIVMWRLEPAVRRRVVALSIAPVVAAVLCTSVFGGSLFSYGGDPLGLASVSWLELVALLLLPAVGLLAALAWIARRERRPPSQPPSAGDRVPVGVG